MHWQGSISRYLTPHSTQHNHPAGLTGRKEHTVESKHYALQVRFHEWEKWETLSGQYATIQEAERARQGKPFLNLYRIVESYTVVRYKPVRGERKAV